MPEPLAPGTQHRFAISGLQPNQNYYIYIKGIKINYGVKYLSLASDPAFCKTKGDPLNSEGSYRLNLTDEMYFPAHNGIYKDANGVVHNLSYIYYWVSTQ
jgi:hypothetical protein